MDRKKFIKLSSSATVFTLFGGIGWLLEGCKKTAMNMAKSIAVNSGNFDNPLRLLPILNGSSPINFTAKQITTTIIKGKTTKALGYTDDILAPIIKVNNGQTVSINFTKQPTELVITTKQLSEKILNLFFDKNCSNNFKRFFCLSADSYLIVKTTTYKYILLRLTMLSRNQIGYLSCMAS